MKKYDTVYKFYNGFAKILLYGKYGFINENCEEICDIKYDSVIEFENGLAGVALNGKWGVVLAIPVAVCLLEFFDDLENKKFPKVS
jgi:hypothetical protein